MNLTGGNTLPNIGKRINWQVITLVAGLATAISVVGPLSLTENDTTQAPSTAVRDVSVPPAGSRVSPASIRPQVIVVDSQAQANTFQAETAADQMAAVMEGYEVPFPTLVVIDSPDKQYLYERILADQMEFGSFDIFDLRGGANSVTSASRAAATSESVESRPAIYIVESAEQGAITSAALEADKLVAVMEGEEVPFQEASFLVVSSPDEERALNEILMEQPLLPDFAFDIIDMRN